MWHKNWWTYFYETCSGNTTSNLSGAWSWIEIHQANGTVLNLLITLHLSLWAAICIHDYFLYFEVVCLHLHLLCSSAILVSSNTEFGFFFFRKTFLFKKAVCFCQNRLWYEGWGWPEEAGTKHLFKTCSEAPDSRKREKELNLRTKACYKSEWANGDFFPQWPLLLEGNSSRPEGPEWWSHWLVMYRKIRGHAYICERWFCSCNMQQQPYEARGGTLEHICSAGLHSITARWVSPRSHEVIKMWFWTVYNKIEDQYRLK